jgi:catechol 2,3-dioxygenase-like lactoylglutathione lyase family enzyme
MGGSRLGQLEALSNVGVLTKDLRRAKQFYTRVMGLEVRDEQPAYGYISLGTSRFGEDASLMVLEPSLDAWGDEYLEAMAHVGEVTGVDFRTPDLNATFKDLRSRGARAELYQGHGPDWVYVWDPDGNVIGIHEDPGATTKKPGLSVMDYVNVTVTDEARAGRFFEDLGMKAISSRGWAYQQPQYRLSPAGTALVPFAPSPDMYEGWADPSSLESDLGAIGGKTYLLLLTRDIPSAGADLKGKGIRFRGGARKAPWGGMEAEFCDPDGNIYSLWQPSEHP